MKKIISTIALFLSFILTFSVFFGCNSNNGGDNPVDPPDTGKKYKYLPDEEWSPETLTSNGVNLGSYKIIVSATADTSVRYAAEILQKYIKAATETEIPVLTDATAESEYEIMIGATGRTEDDGIDFDALGKESFIVRSVGNDLLIAGNERGSLYGVYEFLESLGYRFYTYDESYIPAAKNLFVPTDYERSWSPVFTFRDVMYINANDLSSAQYKADRADWCVAQRVNSNFMRENLKSVSKYGGSVGWIGGDQYMVHTARRLVPYSPTAATQHPDWFARENGRILVSGTDGYDTDLCWSNDEMLDHLYAEMLNKIDNDSKSNIMSLSMNDTTAYCKCENCKKEQAEYGISGWFYRAVNKIAKRLKVDRPNVKLDTIAYSYAINPPDIVMEDNVVVRLCLSACRFHTDEDECSELGGKLKDSRQCLLDWKSHAKEFTVYSYPINWACTLTADPSYQAIYNQYKWYAENNVTGIYCESYPVQDGEFGELKAYLMAKLLVNPSMTYGEYQYHMRDFLHGYYGDGWEFILDYINTTYDIIMGNMADKNYHIASWYSYEENFPFSRYWDGEEHEYDNVIKDIDDCWEDALSLANGTQVKRIKKSRIHWKYIKLYNTFDNIKKFGTEEEKKALYAENEELYNDMINNGVTRRNNVGPTLDQVINFTRSPKGWWNK